MYANYQTANYRFRLLQSSGGTAKSLREEESRKPEKVEQETLLALIFSFGDATYVTSNLYGTIIELSVFT